MLESAVAANPSDAMAHYYLGNLLYDKQRHADAIQHWEASQEANDSFATVDRNLALAYYNTLGRADQALTSLEKAFACNPLDARVFYELDQLYKKLGYAPENRLVNLESHWELVIARDDLYLECITLLNTVKRHEKAITLLSERKFHPWEGGEGKVTGQYVFAHVELGKHYLHAQHDKDAIETLKKALIYPENLGEGKLEDDLNKRNKVHCLYMMGLGYLGLQEFKKARSQFSRALKLDVNHQGVRIHLEMCPDVNLT